MEIGKREIQRMLRAASHNARDLALLAVSAYTLLRIGDLLRLNVGDILDGSRQVRRQLIITQQKTGARVEIELADRLREVLARYLKSRPGARLADPLFVAEGRNPLTRGRRLSRRGAQLIFKKYQRLGLGSCIEQLATHIFRKAFALDIAEQYGVATAQEALGHKNLATTQKYIAREVAKRRANEFRRGLDLL